MRSHRITAFFFWPIERRFQSFTVSMPCGGGALSLVDSAEGTDEPGGSILLRGPSVTVACFVSTVPGRVHLPGVLESLDEKTRAVGPLPSEAEPLKGCFWWLRPQGRFSVKVPVSNRLS